MFSNRKRAKSLSEQVLYHGTPVNFIKLAPQPNRRIKNKLIEWSGKAIFATHDYRIAINYTANKLPDNSITHGVDLLTPLAANEPLCIMLFGGNSEAEALDALFGRIDDPASCTGYIYHLDRLRFKSEVGLGVNERISNSSASVLSRQKINRRETLNRFIEKRLIQLHWMPNLDLAIALKR